MLHLIIFTDMMTLSTNFFLFPHHHYYLVIECAYCNQLIYSITKIFFRLGSKHSSALVAHYFFPLFIFVMLSMFPVHCLIFVISQLKIRYIDFLFNLPSLVVYLDWNFFWCFHGLLAILEVVALVETQELVLDIKVTAAAVTIITTTTITTTAIKRPLLPQLKLLLYIPNLSHGKLSSIHKKRHKNCLDR